jgi:glucose-fructose oxidoreductase
MNTPVSRRTFLHHVSLAGSAVAFARPLSTLAAATGGERKLGVALLGLGSYSTYQLAPALEHTRYCRLAGVVTGTPEKGRHWQKRHNLNPGSVYSYETMDRLADNPDIDIVYVVTPPGTHRDFVVRAAKTGKHIICEKPMANSVAECDEMIAACRAAGRKLSIGYRLQFEPHYNEMERLARDPSFGPFTRMRGANGFRLSGRIWRIDKQLAGGGPLMDMGIYVIQAACRAALAAPVAIIAHEDKKQRPELFNEVEEAIRWTMEFPGGATCEGFTTYDDGVGNFRAENDHDWLELNPAYGYGGLNGVTSRGPMNVPNTPQQAVQMDDFARCILDDRPTAVPGEMGRRDLAIIEAIYASAAQHGARVPVKL